MLVFYKKKECLFQYSNLSLVTFSLWPSPGRNVRCIMANIREDKHGVSQLKPEDGGEREGRGLGPARTAVPGKGRLVPAFSPWMNLEESPTGLPSQHFWSDWGGGKRSLPPPSRLAAIPVTGSAGSHRPGNANTPSVSRGVLDPPQSRGLRRPWMLTPELEPLPPRISGGQV